MNSTFIPVNTQIRILKNKGLVIKDKSKAKKILREVGYHNLIDNYKAPFLDNRVSSERFKENTTIEEIYALYEFDRKIRALTLEHILIIESKVKALIGYQFSKVYGDYNSFIPDNFDTKKNLVNLIRL